jgi:hypothetical protein
MFRYIIKGSKNPCSQINGQIVPEYDKLICGTFSIAIILNLVPVKTGSLLYSKMTQFKRAVSRVYSLFNCEKEKYFEESEK